MTEPDCNMPTESNVPTQCPEGFNHGIWDAVRDKKLQDTFLLMLADELKSKNYSVADVRNCLGLGKSDSELRVQATNSSFDGFNGSSCYDIHPVLTTWQHDAVQRGEKHSVGVLMGHLSQLGVSKSLCSFCATFFRCQGTNNSVLCMHVPVI